MDKKELLVYVKWPILLKDWVENCHCKQQARYNWYIIVITKMYYLTCYIIETIRSDTYVSRYPSVNKLETVSQPYVYRLQPSYNDYTVSCICSSTETWLLIMLFSLSTRKLRDKGKELLSTGRLYTPDKLSYSYLIRTQRCDLQHMERIKEVSDSCLPLTCSHINVYNYTLIGNNYNNSGHISRM